MLGIAPHVIMPAEDQAHPRALQQELLQQHPVPGQVGVTSSTCQLAVLPHQKPSTQVQSMVGQLKKAILTFLGKIAFLLEYQDSSTHAC